LLMPGPSMQAGASLRRGGRLEERLEQREETRGRSAATTGQAGGDEPRAASSRRIARALASPR